MLLRRGVAVWKSEKGAFGLRGDRRGLLLCVCCGLMLTDTGPMIGRSE